MKLHIYARDIYIGTVKGKIAEQVISMYPHHTVECDIMLDSGERSKTINIFSPVKSKEIKNNG
jgi:hypothetical protein